MQIRGWWANGRAFALHGPRQANSICSARRRALTKIALNPKALRDRESIGWRGIGKALTAPQRRRSEFFKSLSI
jgi:hypothetical protein